MHESVLLVLIGIVAVVLLLAIRILLLSVHVLISLLVHFIVLIGVLLRTGRHLLSVLLQK